MPKKPKDFPEIGDRVEWRGHGDRGTLTTVDTDDRLAIVKWDHDGPSLIELDELRKIVS